jgi:hypothetical protein
MEPGVPSLFVALTTGTASAVVAVTGSIGPSTAIDAPASVRAVVSFVLVLAFGGVLLSRYEGFVDRSIDASRDRLLVSVVYGAVAYGLVGFVSLYGYTQLVRLGVGGAVLSVVSLAAGIGAVFALAGLGFLVVGTLVTELNGPRQPWTGLVVGAAASAVAWLVLPTLAGVVAWFLVTAVGIGGATRKWVHATRDERAVVEG